MGFGGWQFWGQDEGPLCHILGVTYMDFWGTSPWTDPEDLGIRRPLLNYSGVGGRGRPVRVFTCPRVFAAWRFREALTRKVTLRL